MGRAEAATIVNAPIDTVWHIFNDIDHTPEWVLNLERAEIISDGPYGVGTVYHDYTRRGGRLEMMPWRIVAFEPMCYQVHEGASSALNLRMSVHMTPALNGTHVRMVMEYTFLPAVPLLGRLLERVFLNRVMRTGVPRNLASMQAYVERVMAGQGMPVVTG